MPLRTKQNFKILDRGEIFTCGDNRYGKLGLNQKTYNSIQFTPTSVQKYQEIKVENVSFVSQILTRV